MEKQFDNIEKSIQSAFSTHEIPVVPEDWQAISKSMDEASIPTEDPSPDTFENRIKSSFLETEKEVSVSDWEAIAAQIPKNLNTPLETGFKKAFSNFAIPVGKNDWRRIFMFLPFRGSGLSRFTILLSGIAVVLISVLSLLVYLWEKPYANQTTIQKPLKSQNTAKANSAILQNIEKNVQGKKKGMTSVFEQNTGLSNPRNTKQIPTKSKNKSNGPENGSIKPNTPISQVPNSTIQKVLKSLENIKNLEHMEDYIIGSSGYSPSQGTLKNSFYANESIQIQGISLVQTPILFHSKHKTSATLKQLRKADLGYAKRLVPYAGLAIASNSGRIRMRQDVNRNKNAFTKKDGKVQSIQWVLNAGLSLNLGRGFSIYGGVSSENNLTSNDSKDTIRIKVPTDYFYYRGTTGEIIYQKARGWKDSLLIASINPSANYIDVPFGISKNFTLKNQWNVILALQGSFGFLASANGQTANPYAYEHPSYLKVVQGINTLADPLVQAKYFLNKTRLNAGASLAIEKEQALRSHGLKVSVNQSLQNQFSASSGLVYSPTRFGIEYVVRFKLFQLK
jgi:hypothetical protein